MESRPMSPEEVARTVQFLLDQQAQFAADFAKLSERAVRMADAIVSVTGFLGRLADDLGQLAEAQQRAGSKPPLPGDERDRQSGPPDH